MPILEAFIEEDLSVDIQARGFDRATVGRVLDLVKRNEYKRRQAPPGVRVSRRAFGRDWRYPITNGYAAEADAGVPSPSFHQDPCGGRRLLAAATAYTGRRPACARTCVIRLVHFGSASSGRFSRS